MSYLSRIDCHLSSDFGYDVVFFSHAEIGKGYGVKLLASFVTSEISNL